MTYISRWISTSLRSRGPAFWAAARIQWLRTQFAGSRAARHAVPLLALTSLHFLAFQRLLRASHGTPLRYVAYDFFNGYYRFLVYISDCLNAGVWPTWFPYGHAGTPFFVNPQTQLWSPITWIVAFLFRYDLVIAQRQLMLTWLLGSIGTYALSYSLCRRRGAALLAAIAFNFTSARISNTGHMDISAAIAALPWVFWLIRSIAFEKHWARPALAVILTLLVVTGYPGVLLACPIWFGLWSLWHFSAVCKTGPCRIQFVGGVSKSVGLASMMATGYWMSIATSLREFTRGKPLETDAALFQSLTPLDLWHYVLGTSTELVAHVQVPDMSMRGYYFGIVAFAFTVMALMYRHDRIVAMLGVGFVSASLMSLGGTFFARIALHDFVPFMNLSRFSSVDSRPVAVLAGCLLAGQGLPLVAGDAGMKRHFIRIVLGLSVLLLFGLVWLKESLFPAAAAASIARHFTGPITLELLVLGIAAVCAMRELSPKAIIVAMLTLVALDGGTHSLVQAHVVALPPDERAKHVNLIHAKHFNPAKALVPRLDDPSLINPLANDAYLSKDFYLPSYTEFRLRRLDALLAAGFRPFLINGQRVVGFVHGMAPPRHGTLFEERATPVKFEIPRYLPDQVDYVVTLPERTTLVFNEVYFPGWMASVDEGAATPMMEVAPGLRGLVVTAGKHSISTSFRPRIFQLGLAVSSTSWFIAVAWLGFATVGRWRQRRRESIANAVSSTEPDRSSNSPG